MRYLDDDDGNMEDDHGAIFRMIIILWRTVSTITKEKDTICEGDGNRKEQSQKAPWTTQIMIDCPCAKFSSGSCTLAATLPREDKTLRSLDLIL
ncbi:hypothetical protein PoB_004848300 [Plakobranchus ocellatus]|uniref:Uncharacterized protein n=1 Tax=Plakobranchus ocellatus TaxID=259542 RepID=A0AAV4BS49_9GAST|nr:hypothetical protein PoB_004848300 [Plakobranchus ocellatus]